MTKKCSHLVVLISILACFSAVALATPSNNIVDTPQEISGAAGSYLPLVAQSQQDTWELVKVVTDSSSGCATPSGLATISGSYTVVQQLGAVVTTRNGRYSWSQPNMLTRLASRAGQPDPEEVRWFQSSLFSYRSDGGMPQSATRYLLCILHESSAGQDKFTNVHLVPDSWQSYVRPAVLYLRDHSKLSDLNAASGMVEARGLLPNSNPYLVLTALQVLAARKSLTPADMGVALASTDIKVVACSIVIAHLYGWLDAPDNVQELKTEVAAITSLDHLEGIALGMLAIAPYNIAIEASPTTDLPNLPKPPAPQDVRNIEQDRVKANLLPLVRQKLTELDPNGQPSDERWRNIDQICRQDEMMQKYRPKPQSALGTNQKP